MTGWRDAIRAALASFLSRVKVGDRDQKKKTFGERGLLNSLEIKGESPRTEEKHWKMAKNDHQKKKLLRSFSHFLGCLFLTLFLDGGDRVLVIVL